MNLGANDCVGNKIQISFSIFFLHESNLPECTSIDKIIFVVCLKVPILCFLPFKKFFSNTPLRDQEWKKTKENRPDDFSVW